MQFSRQVIQGEQLGRKIGFPTLNFEVGDLANAFEHGVHAAWVWIDDLKYKGALYLGPKTDGKIVLEVHVLDFNRTIYGQTVQVEVLQKIRDPQKFKDLEEMTKAIQKDVEEIRRVM